MKSWKPALTILCCLVVAVSSYQTGKYRPNKPHHHIKTTKKMVPSLKAVKVHVASPPPPREAAAQASDTPSTCSTCNGPSYNLGLDEVVPKYAQLIPRVWIQIINTLTEQSYNFMWYLQSRDIRNDSITAVRELDSTFITNYYIPFLSQRPDACAMAAMINATISCLEDGNRTAIQDALTQLQDTYLNDISPRLERTMVHKAGCDFRCGEFPPDPQVNKTVCYENGFVYPIQKVLNFTNNADISPVFKALLLRMYASPNYNDKFFAACTTFAILGTPFELWNPNTIAEIVEMTTSQPVRPTCCYQRIKRAEALRKAFDEDVINYTTFIKREFANGRCN